MNDELAAGSDRDRGSGAARADDFRSDGRATLDAAARDDIDATDDHRADGAARPDKGCAAFEHGCARGKAAGFNDQRAAAADRAGASAGRQDLFGNPVADRTVEDEAGKDFDQRAAAELRSDHDGIAPPFEHAAAAHDEAAHRPATFDDFGAAVLYGRGQRDAGGVHKLEPKRHNSGAAREAGGAEYLLAAGHRCLQRRAGGDYLLEPSQMDGRADRQSGLQYKLVAVADRGTDSGARGENLLSGTADYPRRSRGAAVVDRLCSPAQRGADGPGAGKNILLAGAIYRGADCRTGKLKRLVATARDLGAGRLALDALKAFDLVPIAVPPELTNAKPPLLIVVRLSMPATTSSTPPVTTIVPMALPPLTLTKPLSTVLLTLPPANTSNVPPESTMTPVLVCPDVMLSV
jgi:hypothetical protein